MNFIGSREETNRLEKLMGLVLGKADVSREDNVGRASLDLTLGHQSALGRALHPSNGDLSQEHVFIEVKTDLGFTASDLGAASEGLHDFVQIFFSSSEVENVFLEIRDIFEGSLDFFLDEDAVAGLAVGVLEMGDIGNVEVIPLMLVNLAIMVHVDLIKYGGNLIAGHLETLEGTLKIFIVSLTICVLVR